MKKDGADKRRVARIERRAAIRFEAEGKIKSGVILNFSEFGLFMTADRLLPCDTKITIPIKVAADRVIAIEGTVVWVREGGAPEEGEVESGMGIELNAVPEEYLRFVGKLRETFEMGDRNIETRFEVYHRVRFRSGGKLHKVYAENLSQGGMYLATEEPLERGEELQAELDLPGHTSPIEVVAKVAYRLKGDSATIKGRRNGVGTQFVNLSDEAKARLYHYMKRLEIHRTRPERRQEGKIPFPGSLSDFLVPEILLGLTQEKQTGTLLLERQGISKIIYVKDGRPIYVESNVRTETLGQYLFRQGKVSATDIERSLKELSRGDLQHGEILVQRGVIDSKILAQSLVEHQEEKLFNTFPWFDGTFEFMEGTDWPPDISVLPLRTYDIIFRGVERWYNADLVRAWMGLGEESAIRRRGKVSPDIILPLMARDVLSHLSDPQTIRTLSHALGLPVDRLLPAAFALVIGGWADLDFSATVEEVEPPVRSKKGEKEKEPSELFDLVRRWIDEDFSRLKELNFHDLLGVSKDVGEAELTRAYMERAGRYSSRDVSQIANPEIRSKIDQINAWIRLAYDTLRDSHLRDIYTRRKTSKRAPAATLAESIENERFVLSCVRDLEQGNFEGAAERLAGGMKQFSKDPTIPGYLGWSLFQLDRDANHERAIALLDGAIKGDSTEAPLHYYRGEIYAYLGDWKRAEQFFAQALRLRPQFVSASAARDLVMEKLSEEKKK